MLAMFGASLLVVSIFLRIVIKSSVVGPQK